MSTTSASATAQGFGPFTAERLPIPSRESMSEAQRLAADAIINGPRKAIFGPFVPLLQTPALMEHIGKTGETLRFHGALRDSIRELVICVVSRETGNQFEWQTHAPLAIKAGVKEEAIASLGAGRRPRELPGDQACAVDPCPWRGAADIDRDPLRGGEHEARRVGHALVETDNDTVVPDLDALDRRGQAGRTAKPAGQKG